MKIEKELLNTLSKRELSYFRIMASQSGVLYLKSKPGIAKSAIAKSIATKLGLSYIDLRLSMLDETDMGLFPKVVEIDGVETLKYIPPQWAVLSNRQPTLINFDELNRASDAVRNAALQLLLERCIGSEFCFNENVYMMACGNEGDTDGTNVEPFDAALNNRLIHIKHDLPMDEWIEQFAKQNVHSSIMSFLRAKPSHYYSFNKNEEFAAYPTPRSWTFLSNYITTNYGPKAKVSDFEDDMIRISAAYVGSSASVAFTRFLEDSKNININEILKRENVEELIKDLDRSKKSELLKELETFDVSKMKAKEFGNLLKFLKIVDVDEMVSYLNNLVDKVVDIDKDMKKGSNYHKLFSEFQEQFNIIGDGLSGTED